MCWLQGYIAFAAMNQPQAPAPRAAAVNATTSPSQIPRYFSHISYAPQFSPAGFGGKSVGYI